MAVKCLYHSHVRNCGGEFIKTKEPEPKAKPKAAGRGKKGAAVLSNGVASGTLEAAFGMATAGARQNAGVTDLTASTAPRRSEEKPPAGTNASPATLTGKRKAGAAQAAPHKAAKTAQSQRQGGGTGIAAAPPTAPSRDALATIPLNASDAARAVGRSGRAQLVGNAIAILEGSPEVRQQQHNASAHAAGRAAQQPAARPRQVISLDTDDDDSDAGAPVEVRSAGPFRGASRDLGSAATAQRATSARTAPAAATTDQQGEQGDATRGDPSAPHASETAQPLARCAPCADTEVASVGGTGAATQADVAQEPPGAAQRGADEPVDVRRQRCAEAAMRRFRTMTLSSEG